MGLFANLAIPSVAVAATTLAIAAPVLIHFLFRQRYRVVEWAAMRFLVDSTQKHSRRIDHWWLLLTRIALLLTLLGAMVAVSPWSESLWQSVVPGEMETSVSAPRTHTILILDTTLSMAARSEQFPNSGFEEARRQARDLVASANPGDGFTIITVGTEAAMIVPGPATDHEKLLAEIELVRQTHGQADLAGGLVLATESLSRSPRVYERRVLMVLSDLQKSAWQRLLPRNESPGTEVWSKLAARATIALVNVGHATGANLSVQDLQLLDPIPLLNDPFTMTAQIVNNGNTDSGPIRVECSIARPSENGGVATLMPIEQRQLDRISAGSKSMVRFSSEAAQRFRTLGSHAFQVRILEPDSLPADNAAWLCADVRDGLNCLIVNGRASSDALNQSSAYLAEALSPGGKPIPGNPARPRVVELSEFQDATLTDLTPYNCVFLCDVPTLTQSQMARLDALLTRGGTVVISLGPNAAANVASYNQSIFAKDGGLVSAKLGAIRRVTRSDDLGYRFSATDEAYRLPPMDGFQSDNARGGFAAVPFRQYLSLEYPAASGRRILSFSSAESTVETGLEPALVEFRRSRGKVVVFTSSFHTEWNDWPRLPSFLPFAHELLRYGSSQAQSRNLKVGDRIEQLFPVAYSGLRATLHLPSQDTEQTTINNVAEGGLASFPPTLTGGLYRIATRQESSSFYAVNLEAESASGSESDLRFFDADEIRKALPMVQLTTDYQQLASSSDSVSIRTTTPRPHGPKVARVVGGIVFALLGLELWLAWRFGPSRLRSNVSRDVPPTPTLFGRILTLLSVVVILISVLMLAVVTHADLTQEPLGFLPQEWRLDAERLLEVPTAGVGESTRWRLETPRIVKADWFTNHRVIVILSLIALGATFLLYRREATTVKPIRRLILPIMLRLAAYAILILVVLPQVRLRFDREGWPDVAIILDTSMSMSTVDRELDEKSQTRLKEVLPYLQGKPAERLELVKFLLTRTSDDWLTKLLTERNYRLHLFQLADQTTPVDYVETTDQLAEAKSRLAALSAKGESSAIGNGIEQVLKTFRGGNLSGVIFLSDGITTNGDDIVQAGREAARAGVPLYLVGLGNSQEPLDLAVNDLRVEEIVAKNDELVFDARLTVRGPFKESAVTVHLYERVAGKLIERDSASVRPEPSGKPANFRLKHTPTEVGEKVYIVQLDGPPSERELTNNRVERLITVTDNRRVRVLMVEGYPRYEFRFVKVLLERELEPGRNFKSVELKTLLLDASKDHATTDRSALRGFPTRNELFEYDVVIFGDVDPSQFPNPAQTFQDLADFVKIRGGGLLISAGEHAVPMKLFDTPLADILPIVPTNVGNAPAPNARPEDVPITQKYRPRLTATGLIHPLLSFGASDGSSQKIWEQFQPLYWHSSGYRPRPIAEVLAVHPDQRIAGTSDPLPLIVQQFAGAGRVMFLGFDETWRWRFRKDEEQFNRFWRQAIRVLSRNRVSRVDLVTDKQTPYRRDEPIRLTARFPDDAAPPQTDTIKLIAERRGSRGANDTANEPELESSTIALTKVPNSRGEYEFVLKRTPEGEYRFRFADATTSRSTAEARVLPPPGELTRLEMNFAEFQQAAAESHGKAYTFANADELLTDFPEVIRQPLAEPCPPRELWNQFGVFALCLLLLATEWLLRRQLQLV